MSDPTEAHLERVARFRAAATRRGGPWAAKRELAAALRELLARLPSTAAPAEAVRELLPHVREATRAFAAAGRAEPPGEAPSLYAGMEHFHDVGPLVGLSNAIAPPLELVFDREARVVRAHGRFGAAYEGAPGLLHGGFLAAAFDELLGMATVFSGGPGMTRELSVRFLRPTPIDVELAFVGRFDRKEGRRIFVSAEVEAAGERTAEASGVFTAVGGENFEAFARARRERSGRASGG
jgi:acyl-coenzyme A thioesterase PaaI-like protein